MSRIRWALLNLPGHAPSALSVARGASDSAPFKHPTLHFSFVAAFVYYLRLSFFALRRSKAAPSVGVTTRAQKKTSGRVSGDSKLGDQRSVLRADLNNNTEKKKYTHLELFVALGFAQRRRLAAEPGGGRGGTGEARAGASGARRRRRHAARRRLAQFALARLAETRQPFAP